MKRAAPPVFGAEAFEVWREVLSRHRYARENQVCDLFLEGLNILGISEERIPNLEDVNRILLDRTGFQGVYVEGFEEPSSFFEMLARGEFPIGNFIRSREDLSYTPAPDVLHDLYGHLPFFTSEPYARFCRKFGRAAVRHGRDPRLLRQFDRVFWFTIEFGLVKTARGTRVFGAGIASSVKECEYALSGVPEVVPFDVDAIRAQEFRIDILQPKLFLLENAAQLYGSLDELVARVDADASLLKEGA